jgi:hypothetical protein
MMGEDEVAEIRAAKRKQKEMQAQREVQKIEKFEMIKASLDDASDGTVKKAAKKAKGKAKPKTVPAKGKGKKKDDDDDDSLADFIEDESYEKKPKAKTKTAKR